MSKANDLQTGVSELIEEGFPGQYGISAAMDPNAGMTPGELAIAANLPNRQITYTTAPELQAIGHRVIPAPYGDRMLHASILLRPGETALTNEEAERLSNLLGLNRMENPNFVPKKRK